MKNQLTQTKTMVKCGACKQTNPLSNWSEALSIHEGGCPTCHGEFYDVITDLKLNFDMNGVQIGNHGFISYDDTDKYDDVVSTFQDFSVRGLLDVSSKMTVTDIKFADALIKLVKGAC